ncbi:ABC transporter permease [Methyloligella sp. 2.7D]|uniref:ABC transporter permease n=1 Tax=unclassified Methyloligella TaxID=2625955 RepID=UPI00157DD209|nr:ABC transporter permease [Methyloligella sp. GL2]QKP76006.1 ABC transporter permease [Methyloligella sp. GL2]
MLKQRQGWLSAAPAIIVFAVLFVAPLSMFFVVSFWQVKLFALVPTFTFANYAKTFQEYSGSLLFTLVIGLTVGFVTTALAFGFAYVIRFRAGKLGPLLLFMALFTLFGGYLVKIYAWKTILGREGILNTALMWVGVIDEPLTMLLYSPFAVIITLVHYLLPLAILPIYGSLIDVDDHALEAARDLGAKRGRVMLGIVLPQARFGVIAAFAMSFLVSAGDYVTPRLVGGTQTSMLGNFIEGQFGLRMNAPLGSAMSFTMLVVCLAIIIGLWFLSRLTSPR